MPDKRLDEQVDEDVLDLDTGPEPVETNLDTIEDPYKGEGLGSHFFVLSSLSGARRSHDTGGRPFTTDTFRKQDRPGDDT